MQVHRKRPRGDQWCRDEERDQNRSGVTCLAPGCEWRDQDRGESDERRRRRPLAQEGKARGSAEQRTAKGRPPRRERERIKRKRIRGQHADIGRKLVRAIPKPDAADEEQHRQPSKRAAVELAAGQGEKPERDSKAERISEPRAVVQGQEHMKASRRDRGERVEQRGPLGQRAAGEMSNHGVAALEHVESDAEAGRVVGLPGIMAKQAERDPCRAEQNQPRLLQRAVASRGRKLGSIVPGNGVGERHPRF